MTVTARALPLIDVSDPAACGPDDCAPPTDRTTDLDERSAATYAEWFAVLADPTRVRLLHTVSTARSGAIRVGDLAEALGISQSTCSHHVKKLAEVGFVAVDKVGTASVVSVNPACCTGLPHAADVVMGTLATLPCCPEDLPPDVSTRAMTGDDLDVVRDIYAEGLATRNATFETKVPSARRLADKWLPGHTWVAELDGAVVGWAAAAPVSSRDCYAGVAETSVYVTGTARGRGVGKTLLHRQVTEADARRPVDAADVDLPREPRLHRPAPLRRLPHPGGAPADRQAGRRLARHGAARAAPGDGLTHGLPRSGHEPR